MSEALLILFVLCAWTALLTVVAGVRRLVRGRPTAEEVDVEDLRAQYARGEIPYAEYDGRRRALRERPPRPRPLRGAGADTPGGRPPR